MTILETCGAGYIGSHTCVELLSSGYDVIVVDNLCNSSKKAIDRVKQITGKTIQFYKADIRDEQTLDVIFDTEKIDAVIHFAGFKAVGESVFMPLAYYENNIFSSSVTVYGETNTPPLSENLLKGVCTNPYGWTKWMIEQILTDLHTADSELNVTLLRYFNPIGAHRSGLIGEDPKGTPTLCGSGRGWQTSLPRCFRQRL